MLRATRPARSAPLGVFVGALLLCAASPLRAGSLDLQEVSPGLYVHPGAHEEATPENLGGFANIGFIVGEAAVAVIDSGGSAAQGRLLRAAIREKTDLPIRYVILTHMHPDHVFGNAAFEAEGTTFVGHHKLPRALAARGSHYLGALRDLIGDRAAGTRVVEPSLLVEDSLALDLGGRRLHLTAHPTAHSDNDLTVFDERTRTLWAGDLLFMERTPAIDGSLLGWLSVMESLRALPAERVVPGHGPAAAPWPEALAPQQRYLTRLRDEIRAIIARGGTMEEAVETVGRSERGRWRLFDSYHARNTVTAFAELEWE